MGVTAKLCTHRLQILSHFEFVALHIFHMSGGPALPWGAVPHDQRPHIEVDLPSRKGLYPGARIEVKWLIDDDEAQTREIRVSIHLHSFHIIILPSRSLNPLTLLPSFSSHSGGQLPSSEKSTAEPTVRVGTSTSYAMTRTTPLALKNRKRQSLASLTTTPSLTQPTTWS